MLDRLGSTMRTIALTVIVSGMVSASWRSADRREAASREALELGSRPPQTADSKADSKADSTTHDPCEAPALRFPLPTMVRFGDSFGDPRSGGRRHEGVDIVAPKRTPVHAAAAGTVRWLHDQAGGRCCAIALLHENGWRTRYLHLDNDTPGTDDGLAVGIAPGLERGAHVEAGQLIGWVGDSGNAERIGSHLHFELRDPSGVAVNATELLRVAAELVPREIEASEDAAAQ